MLNPLFDRYYERDSQKSKEVLNKENKDARGELEGNNKRLGWKSDSASPPLRSASSTVVDEELNDLDWDEHSQCADKLLRGLCGKESLDDDEWERYKGCIAKLYEQLLNKNPWSQYPGLDGDKSDEAAAELGTEMKACIPREKEPGLKAE